MAGILPHDPVLDEADQPTDSERLYSARLYYAIHDNVSLADAFRKYGLEPTPNNYAHAKRMGFGEWREGYRDLVSEDLRVRGKQRLASQLYRNRKLAEKIGDMVDSIDTDASKEWHPRQKTGNVESISKLQRAHSDNTVELLRIYGEPTDIHKHTGELPDLSDPVELAARAKRLADEAQRKLDDDANRASGNSGLDSGEAVGTVAAGS